LIKKSYLLFHIGYMLLPRWLLLHYYIICYLLGYCLLLLHTLHYYFRYCHYYYIICHITCYCYWLLPLHYIHYYFTLSLLPFCHAIITYIHTYVIGHCYCYHAIGYCYIIIVGYLLEQSRAEQSRAEQRAESRAEQSRAESRTEQYDRTEQSEQSRVSQVEIG
jgi:uncharacterized membrane protein